MGANYDEVTNPLRVLVVDDYPPHVEALVSALCEYGRADAKGAATGEEGLKIALKWQPQLIICDGLLEGMNAWIFWDNLLKMYSQKGYPKPYCVTMTGFPSQQHQSLNEECGADEYVGKPQSLPYVLTLFTKARTREEQNRPALVEFPSGSKTKEEDRDTSDEEEVSVLTTSPRVLLVTSQPWLVEELSSSFKGCDLQSVDHLPGAAVKCRDWKPHLVLVFLPWRREIEIPVLQRIVFFAKDLREKGHGIYTAAALETNRPPLQTEIGFDEYCVPTDAVISGWKEKAFRLAELWEVRKKKRPQKKIKQRI